jgi:aminoethylphosphonate catabolism LysR family transcriptional regulator
MNFTQLRAFHAVARQGGITRAAAWLGVSQPAVTAQIKALEARYGIELLRRHGQGVALTAFGRELFRRSRPLFAQLDDLDDLLAAAGALEVGELALGADGPFAVMDLLAAFLARHPAIRVSLRMGNAERVLADLVEGRTDVAVLNLTEPGAELHRRILGEDRLVAFVPAAHGFAARGAVPLAELAAAGLILREPGSATRRLLLDALDARGLAPSVRLELGSREAVREAVLAGLGVGTVFARELVPDPRLRVVPIADADLRAAVSLACLAERRELRVVQAVFAAARPLPPCAPAGDQAVG